MDRELFEYIKSAYSLVHFPVLERWLEHRNCVLRKVENYTPESLKRLTVALMLNPTEMKDDDVNWLFHPWMPDIIGMTDIPGVERREDGWKELSDIERLTNNAQLINRWLERRHAVQRLFLQHLRYNLMVEEQLKRTPKVFPSLAFNYNAYEVASAIDRAMEALREVEREIL